MGLIERFRLPAILCSFAFFLCELVSHPFANMGVGDDWPYILMAKTLAETGHVTYNGFATAMLGWQLYLAATFIKLFGYSLTTVRMSTMVVGMALAFVLQRTLVRTDISERNATIGTLAFVLSPLYMMLSVTFMTDIFGLFAIVLCLYGCLRALQSLTSRATIAWLCFAVVTNAVCGTSRQIAWLGILSMVPSTLWLLRAQRRDPVSQRRVLIAGVAFTLIGVVFIFGCMRWLRRQQYSVPEHLLPSNFSVVHGFLGLLNTFVDMPFLLLPIVAMFIPEIRKSRPRVVTALFLVFLLVTVHPRHLHHVFLLVPVWNDWIPYTTSLQGEPPTIFNIRVHLLTTVVSLGGLLGLIASFFRNGEASFKISSSATVPWNQLAVLLGPFNFCYILLLIPRAATSGIHDRYLFGLLVVGLICLVRYYQDQIQTQFPLATMVLVGCVALYGIAVTHNAFALYRARVALAAELRAAGISDTSVDNGWEYNLGVELDHANHINEPAIEVPKNAFVPTLPPTPDTCRVTNFQLTPHIRPSYSVSFDPNACDGAAPFAPVRYSRWMASAPGTIYVVWVGATAAP